MVKRLYMGMFIHPIIVMLVLDAQIPSQELMTFTKAPLFLRSSAATHPAVYVVPVMVLSTGQLT